MVSLPSLRRKILRSFLVMILLYAGLGVFLVVSFLIATAATPKLLHVNYDSIAAASQMREAWTALHRPEDHAESSPAQWVKQFDSALKFEQGNVTEPGERELEQGIRKIWEHNRSLPGPFLHSELEGMNRLLSKLVAVNEQGMFRSAQAKAEWSHRVLLGAIVYFLVTLILAFLLADGLANRLSRPLKSIAEALHRKPSIGRRLKLVEPNSLELLILTQELSRLWDRVTEGEKVNVLEIVQQKNKLETVLESVEDGLLVVESSGMVSHANSCLLELLGLQLDQVKGKIWSDLSTSQNNYLKLRALLRQEMPEAHSIELDLKSARHHFSARSRKILGPDRNTIATLYLLHDITEKKQREKFRSEFIDLLSHELKTPLQSLGTASELLAAKKLDLPDMLQPLVETISEDVERIRAVANEFVQVTQSHSKIMKLKLDRVALNQVVQDWIKPFHIVARDRNVKLVYTQEGSEVIWGRLDAVKFPWVISNLLSNAIRFSPAGSQVEILLTDRNGCVEIGVRDEGPGITDEDQRRMFEPFFQSTTLAVPSSKQGLFGIGLTIAKEVVEAHDGRIEYYSRQPRGSEFRIVLPFPAEAHS